MGLREKACVPWGMEEKEINDNGEEKLKCGTGSHSCRKSLGQEEKMENITVLGGFVNLAQTQTYQGILIEKMSP